jgi:hypothetical protein
VALQRTSRQRDPHQLAAGQHEQPSGLTTNFCVVAFGTTTWSFTFSPVGAKTIS